VNNDRCGIALFMQVSASSRLRFRAESFRDVCCPIAARDAAVMCYK
jgi:hypothetical protein